MVLDLVHLDLEFVSACPGATLLELILVVAKFRKQYRYTHALQARSGPGI